MSNEDDMVARKKRRDELAREFSPFGRWPYAAHSASTQKAIDYIIDLESAA